MAMTNDRDVMDAIWYATDAIGKRLTNDSMFIEKAKKSMENLKAGCYNIDLDNDRGLGEQKQYVWEDWNLKDLRLPKLKVPESEPVTNIPTRKEIYSKISEFRDKDLKANQYILVYSYTFENGLHARTEIRIDADKVGSSYHARESTKAINKLIDMVLDQYNDEYSKEEYGMTNTELRKIENDIRMIKGNFTVEGIASNDWTAHIEVPFEYLKHIKVAMPTTDFCVSKRKDAGNWIEGLPAIKKIETYNDRVTKVTFIDDTFTKAVCSENDHFDEDAGITICCMKRLFGKDGNRMYNDMIRKAHKVMDENNKKKEAEAKEKAERKLKARKAAGKKAAKKLIAKQEQIDIQTQAIIQAHDALEARNSEA